MKAGSPTVCTIIAWNYLAQARILAASLLETNPGAHLVVLVVDRGPSPAAGAKESFEILMVDELGIDGFEAMTFRYTLVELTTSVKPFLLEFLLRTRPLPHVIYLDPDIQVMSTLDAVVAFFREAVVLLTPHALAPIEEGGTPSEQGILLSGCFNLGFIGVRADPEAYRMLAWWQSRLRAAGWHEFSARRIPFGTFDNGVEVALVMRRIWEEGGGEKRWRHPFDTQDIAGFYQWMMALVPGSSGRQGNLSRLALEIHRRRPDLQRLFPDPCGSDNRSYRLWFVTDGALNHRIPRELSGAPVPVPVSVAVSILGELRRRLPESIYLRGRKVLIRIWNWCRRWRG